MKEVTREFEGIWIPSQIWLSKELTIHEKVLISKIIAYSNSSSYCNCTNSYFASFFQVSNTRISQLISSLKKKKVLDVCLVYKGKQIVERRITVNYSKITSDKMENV